MDTYQYVLLMALCLLVTLPLELVLGARVWRRPRRLLLALLPVVVIFSIWDVVAIARGTWSYSERFTTGVILPLGLPLEELVFFLVVPVCGLLTYEAVGNVLVRVRRRDSPGTSTTTSTTAQREQSP
jgi:lycopene cyclase domain-containing protein